MNIRKKFPIPPPKIHQYYDGDQTEADLLAVVQQFEDRHLYIWRILYISCVIYMLTGILALAYLIDLFDLQISDKSFLFFCLVHAALGLVLLTTKIVDKIANCFFSQIELKRVKAAKSALEKLNAFKSAEEAYKKLLDAFNNETSIYFWLQLKGIDLEKRLQEMLERVGYSAEMTAMVGDGGIDLNVLDPKGITFNIQCKGHSKKLGVASIRDAAGVMAIEKVKMVVVSPRGFTAGAIEFADKAGIELWDASELVEVASSYKSGNTY